MIFRKCTKEEIKKLIKLGFLIKKQGYWVNQTAMESRFCDINKLIRVTDNVVYIEVL